MKKVFLAGALIIALFIAFNAIKSEVHEETTVVAKHVEKFGSSWYVDENRLDKSFKQGISNPKSGDTIDLELDSEGRVIGWKVK